MSFPDKQKSYFSKLYNEYVNDLYAYGTNLGFASDICMDAIQDVFCNVYLRQDKLKHIDNMRFYLFRSLRNRLVDLQKQQHTTERLVENDLAFSIEVSVADIFENEEERILLKQKVERLLSILTDRQREAVYLRYMQGLDYEKIGETMEMNSASVRKLVYRALEVIRKHTKSR